MPASRLAIAWRWMNSTLPDVQAAGRLVEDEQPQVPVELARHDQLLLVATGQRAGRDGRRRRADVELLDGLGRARA